MPVCCCFSSAVGVASADDLSDLADADEVTAAVGAATEDDASAHAGVASGAFMADGRRESERMDAGNRLPTQETFGPPHLAQLKRQHHTNHAQISIKLSQCIAVLSKG